MITATLDNRQYKELQEVLDPKQLRQALFQAAQRTKRTLVKEIAKEATAVLNLKTAPAKEAITATVHKGDKPGVTVTISHRQNNALNFKGARAGKRGVSVQFRKDKPRLRWSHGFKATMKSGHTGFWRRAKIGKVRQLLRKVGLSKRTSNYAGRLPIQPILGPSVYSIFAAKRKLTPLGVKMSERARELYMQNLISQVTGRFGARLPTSLAA